MWELEETCSLDVAERGGVTLQEVSEVTGLKVLSVRQLEVNALVKFQEALIDPDPPPRRRLRRVRWKAPMPGQDLLLRQRLRPWPCR